MRISGFVIMCGGDPDGWEYLIKDYYFDDERDLSDFMEKLSDAFSHVSSGEVPIIVTLDEFTDYMNQCKKILC